MAGKSVLVIDTPKDCGDCPCLHDELWMCQADTEHREAEYSGRPSWCPLKPLPQKVEMDMNEYYEGMADGWNACIDEIMGETE